LLISNLIYSIGKFIFGLAVVVGVCGIFVLVAVLAPIVLGLVAKPIFQLFMIGWNF